MRELATNFTVDSIVKIALLTSEVSLPLILHGHYAQASDSRGRKRVSTFIGSCSVKLRLLPRSVLLLSSQTPTCNFIRNHFAWKLIQKDINRLIVWWFGRFLASKKISCFCISIIDTYFHSFLILNLFPIQRSVQNDQKDSAISKNILIVFLVVLFQVSIFLLISGIVWHWTGWITSYYLNKVSCKIKSFLRAEKILYFLVIENWSLPLTNFNDNTFNDNVFNDRLKIIVNDQKGVTLSSPVSWRIRFDLKRVTI